MRGDGASEAMAMVAWILLLRNGEVGYCSGRVRRRGTMGRLGGRPDGRGGTGGDGEEASDAESTARAMRRRKGEAQYRWQRRA